MHLTQGMDYGNQNSAADVQLCLGWLCWNLDYGTCIRVMLILLVFDRSASTAGLSSLQRSGNKLCRSLLWYFTSLLRSMMACRLLHALSANIEYTIQNLVRVIDLQPAEAIQVRVKWVVGTGFLSGPGKDTPQKHVQNAGLTTCTADVPHSGLASPS